MDQSHRRADDVSAGDRHPVPPCQRSQSPVERLKVAHALVALEPQRYDGKPWNRGHGGEIRDVDREGFVAKALPIRPVAPKMHVLNQTVRRHDDIFARERLPDRGIVADPYWRPLAICTSAGSDAARSSISPNSPTSRTRRSSVICPLIDGPFRCKPGHWAGSIAPMMGSVCPV